MKHSTTLLSAALAACTMDNGITAQSPTYHEETCVDNLSGDVISYKNVDPSAFPLDVSAISDVGIFKEIFEGYRNEIYAVTTVQNEDSSYSFYDTEILSAINDIDFASANIQYENGDFQVISNLGVVPGLSYSTADILITDASCETLYGYAGYFFTPNETSYDTSLQYYLDENGDLVYL